MKAKRVAAVSAAAMMFGAGGAFAADLNTLPTKAPVYKAAADAACTSIADFFTTDCQLSAYGVRLYGTVDIGFGYQTNGAPFDKFFPTGGSYFLQKMNRQAMWGLAPNGLSQSNIGISITEPLGAGWKFVGQLEAGFDPYSMQLANGPGSLTDNLGKSTGFQTVNADSGRNGTFYNGQSYFGFKNDTWGTLTFFRQNSLTLDGVNNYDPMLGSYAFSPIGFSGKVPGAGNTEDTRYNGSVKYRVNLGQYFNFGAIAEFGGLDLGNGAEQAFEASLGGKFHVGPGDFTFDVIGGHMKDAVNLGFTGGANNTALKATISDNTNVMVLVKYTIDKLKLSAGYEWIHYDAPSDLVNAAGTSFGGINLLDGANTGFNPVTAFGNQASQIFQVYWAGARYSIITDKLDIAAAYYRYDQNNAAGAPAGCATNPTTVSGGSACSGTMNAASVMLDWKFAPKWDTYIGTFYSETNGGMNNGFLAHENISTTAGVRFRF